MRNTEVALTGAAAAIVFATGALVAPAAGQESDRRAMYDVDSAETPFEAQVEVPRVDDLPAPRAVESVRLAGSDLGEIACVAEDGSVSMRAGRAEEAATDKCPKWVRLDLFEEVDYGHDGIGITMCRLTEQYETTQGRSFLAGLGAKIIAAITGRLERKTWDESKRQRCDYHGCGLDISLSEANWAARN